MGVYKLDGIPSDTLNTDKEGFRRFKVESMPRQNVEIFNGKKFQLSNEHTLSSGQSVNAMALTTHANVDTVLSLIHLNCKGGDTKLEVFEAATVSGGSDATPQNMNRQSSNLPLSTAKTLPTVSVAGQVFTTYKIYGSSTGVASATIASTRDDDFIVLKHGTTYLFRLTNTGADASTCFCKLQWYELVI